ncbi:TetR family transcriptional regulator [Altererythrobacter salegens]|uniref:TetR family transcriptional regulator n=1 Tax=Croceibacterium salegens TaxID=1737568 RepID=A0A6I4SX12_9SPHN|nr:TetR/AcrR family transcriptional regulator [Croceibacterium salegens]MXO59366.1 TetR family transcriptional regulator [Croceibacterium salegens]
MKTDSDTRTYKQTARAKAAEETGERIVQAFYARMQVGWFEDIRLDDVAADAGVTVQTVIRRFGGKDGLLAAASEYLGDKIMTERKASVGDVGRAVEAIVKEYEAQGELIMRALAQEDRYPQIRAMTDKGRATHRQWVGLIFAPWLEPLELAERRHAHDRLVIALDLYVWKLLRVDMKRSLEDLRRTMLEMAAAALYTTPLALLEARTPENTDA